VKEEKPKTYKHPYIHCVGKIQSFSVLKQVVDIVTTVFISVKGSLLTSDTNKTLLYRTTDLLYKRESYNNVKLSVLFKAEVEKYEYTGKQSAQYLHFLFAIISPRPLRSHEGKP
jgi:hypothetical protein